MIVDSPKDIVKLTDKELAKVYRDAAEIIRNQPKHLTGAYFSDAGPCYCAYGAMAKAFCPDAVGYRITSLAHNFWDAGVG